ncbi:MAG: dehypoxanthine futalosine cyclase, partial [Bacteroidales bacterium]
EWVEVMREAHKLNLPTSATMMYGHTESIEQRLEHLFRIRDLQDEKPPNNYGFITFVPWPFQAENTRLKKRFPGSYQQFADEYLRVIAVSRILLNNID